MKNLIAIILLTFLVTTQADPVFDDSFEEPKAIYIIDHFCFEYDPITDDWYWVPCPVVFADSFEQE